MHPLRLAAAAACLAVGANMASAATVSVTIKDLVFAPAEISAHVGDTIEWVNQDFIAHTATARSKDWDVMIPPGKTVTMKVTKAGTMDYFCRFHPNMTGRVTITQ